MAFPTDSDLARREVSLHGHTFSYRRAGSGPTVLLVHGMAGLLIVEQSKEVAIMIESLIVIWSASEAEEWREKVDYLPV